MDATGLGAFLFWKQTWRSSLFVMMYPIFHVPLRFLPGFEIAFLHLSRLSCVFAGEAHPMPSEVVGKITFYNNFNDDHLQIDYETSEEFASPNAKRARRLVAVKTGFAVRAVGKFRSEDSEEAVDVRRVVSLAVFGFRDGDCIFVVLDHVHTPALDLRSM